MSQPSNNPPRSRIDYGASNQALQAQGGDADEMRRHKTFLDARIERIKEWVTQGVEPEALVRFVLRDMAGDKGAKLRECTPQSIYLGLLACAVTGLEPGALKGEAYLVPYKNKGVMEATFMPGWRGLVKQALRSLKIAAISPQVVYERDTFDLDLGSANVLVHKPARSDRGRVIGAYAIARMVNGCDEIEWMDLDDLNAVRRAGKEGQAWDAWAEQMYRKAPIRRLCKRLPMGAGYFVALDLENAADAGGSRAQRDIIDIETDGEGARGDLAGNNAAAMLAQAQGVGVIEQHEQLEIARREKEAAARP